MSLRDSISKPFKGLKHRLAKDNRKRGEGSGREVDTEGTETGQSSHLHPEIEDVVEGGPGQKEDDGKGKNAIQVAPLTSTTSIDSGKPDGERAKPRPYYLS